MNVVGAGTCQRLFSQPALGLAVDQPEAARRVADRDVVRHREVGYQRQFLKDAYDTGRIGRSR